MLSHDRLAIVYESLNIQMETQCAGTALGAMVLPQYLATELGSDLSIGGEAYEAGPRFPQDGTHTTAFPQIKGKSESGDSGSGQSGDRSRRTGAERAADRRSKADAASENDAWQRVLGGGTNE